MEERNNVQETPYNIPGQKGFLEGNPGRPKGSFSLKTKIIKYLEDNPETMGEVVRSLAADEKNRQLLWQMIDGRPPQELRGDPDNPALLVVPYSMYEREAARHSRQDSQKPETV